MLNFRKTLSDVHAMATTHRGKPQLEADAVKRVIGMLKLNRPGGTPKACLMQRLFYMHVILDHRQLLAQVT
jgi:hypothetical protein